MLVDAAYTGVGAVTGAVYIDIRLEMLVSQMYTGVPCAPIISLADASVRVESAIVICRAVSEFVEFRRTNICIPLYLAQVQPLAGESSKGLLYSHTGSR